MPSRVEVLQPRKVTIGLCLLQEIVQLLFLKLTRVLEVVTQRTHIQIPSLVPHKPPWINIGVCVWGGVSGKDAWLMLCPQLQSDEDIRHQEVYV